MEIPAQWVPGLHEFLRWATIVFLLLAIGAAALEIKVSNIKDRLLNEKQQAQQKELEKTIRNQTATEKRLREQLATGEQKLSTTAGKLSALEAQRSLTSEQKNTLVRLLSQSPGHLITVVCIAGDTEGKNYAEDFASVLIGTGWNVTGVAQMVYDTNPVGVWVLVKDPKREPPGASILSTSLKNAGVEAEDGVDPQVTADSIELLIGTRP